MSYDVFAECVLPRILPFDKIGRSDVKDRYIHTHTLTRHTTCIGHSTITLPLLSFSSPSLPFTSLYPTTHSHTCIHMHIIRITTRICEHFDQDLSGGISFTELIEGCRLFMNDRKGTIERMSLSLSLSLSPPTSSILLQ